jgi:hypothetical protein
VEAGLEGLPAGVVGERLVLLSPTLSFHLAIAAHARGLRQQCWLRSVTTLLSKSYERIGFMENQSLKSPNGHNWMTVRD